MVEEMPKNTIYISNINEKIKINELKRSLSAVFCQFGEILDIVAHKNLKMRGQAFVAFQDPTSASSALKSMQGFPFHNKPMNIQYAKVDSYAVEKMKGTYIERIVGTTVDHKSNERKKKKCSKEPKDPNQNPNQPGLLPGVPPGAMVHNLVSNAFGSPRPVAPVAPITMDAPPNQILFLSNLPSEVNGSMLSMLFNQYSGFKEVRLIPGRHDIAFVEFESEKLSTIAKTQLQGFKLTPTHPLKITFAKK